MLPGGLWENGARLRDYVFRPVDGALEMALADAGETAESLPAAVTAALATALARLGGAAASVERVRALCVADRQFLMRELERHLGRTGGWHQTRCQHCAEPFDFHLDYADLPVTEAAPSYPWVSVTIDGEPWQFRLPNGEDQERLAGVDDDEALRLLLGRCRVAPANGALSSLDDAELALIDAAMDTVSPAVVTEVSAPCPQCGKTSAVGLNPYGALGRAVDHLLTEVHQLAYHYHWSEREILALPRSRRQRYLQLIDRARGMVQ